MLRYYNFFVQQKPAYEMQIGDWSSDVCSSDLQLQRPQPLSGKAAGRQGKERRADVELHPGEGRLGPASRVPDPGGKGRLQDQFRDRPALDIGTGGRPQIGRASCRERVCQYE